LSKTFSVRAARRGQAATHRKRDYLNITIKSQPHVAIVTNHPAKGRDHALVVYNIGAGTQIEDRLFEFRISGHFRLAPGIG
jgi:uncharacterized protein YijF (DUF1287 family)